MPVRVPLIVFICLYSLHKVCYAHLLGSQCRPLRGGGVVASALPRRGCLPPYRHAGSSLLNVVHLPVEIGLQLGASCGGTW